MAVRKELVEYVNKGMASGHSKDSLRKTMVGRGWHAQDVDDSINASSKGDSIRVPAPPPHGSASAVPGASHGNMGILEKTRMILKHPSAFFDRVKADQEMGEALKYYAVITIITAVAGGFITAVASSLSIFGFFQGTASMPGSLGSTTSMLFSLMLVGGVITSYIQGIIGIFIGAGFLHVFVYLLGGRKGVIQTFKALAYSYPPSIIAMLVAIVMVLVAVSGLIPSDYSYSTLWVLVGAVAAFGIWSYYIIARGLSKLHEVSFSRGVLMAISPLIIAGVIALILISSALLALGTFNPATWTGTRSTGFADLGNPSDWSYESDGTLVVTLKNSKPTPITISQVTATCRAGEWPEMTTSSSRVVSPEGTIDYYLSGCDKMAVGSSYSTALTVNYIEEGAPYSRTDTGTITGQII